MQQIYLTSAFRGFKRAWNTRTIDDHPQRKVILKRLKIIKFFDQYGPETTKDAFGVSRSTLYLWKQRLKKAKGRLAGLAPESRKPKRFRASQVDLQLKQFILEYRLDHPGVGKEAIKYALDRYCSEQELETISESTVGRIITKLKEQSLIPKRTKLSLYARTGNLIERKVKPKKKLRRKGYQPKEPGDLVQVDSITIFLAGAKRYLINAIDLTSCLGFGYCYPSLSSKNAQDFFSKLEQVTPFKIKRIQTDNGSEFEDHFRSYLKERKITHFHNYPKHPQANGNVERFNRTIKEQYLDWHKGELYQVDSFNRGFMKYLLWYNTEKPHRTLNKQPPLQYLANLINRQPKLSNMLWTPTAP